MNTYLVDATVEGHWTGLVVVLAPSPTHADQLARLTLRGQFPCVQPTIHMIEREPA